MRLIAQPTFQLAEQGMEVLRQGGGACGLVTIRRYVHIERHIR